MDAYGKIIVKLPLQSGTSKAGNPWSKQEYVLETAEAYPKKICFTFFGDRANQYPLEVGQNIHLSFDIDSHEYNGRWFTNINGWKSEPWDPQQPQQPAAPAPMVGAPAQPYQAPAAPQAAPAPAPAPGNFQQPEPTDDLPF